MWRAALAALLFAAPTKPQPPKRICLTPCGMMADVESLSCAGLVLAEAVAVEGFGVRVEGFPDPHAICNALSGWTVRPHRGRLPRDAECGPTAWWEPGHGCVLGMTYFENKTIAVETEDWFENSLSHEIAHVVDVRMLGGSSQHCHWKKRGISQAIEIATGRPDNNDDDCEGPK